MTANNSSLDGLVQFIRINVKEKDFDGTLELFYNVVKQLYAADSLALLKVYSEIRNFRNSIPYSSDNKKIVLKFNELSYIISSEDDIRKLLSIMDTLKHKALSSAYSLVLIEDKPSEPLAPHN